MDLWLAVREASCGIEEVNMHKPTSRKHVHEGELCPGTIRIHVPYHGYFYFSDKLSREYLHNLATGILSYLGLDYSIGNPRLPREKVR